MINHALHTRLYSSVDQTPRFYGLPKMHKSNRLCPIETYRHLSPLVGKKQHVRNSKNFAKEICITKIAPEEEFRSYNVSVHQRPDGQSTGGCVTNMYT